MTIAAKRIVIVAFLAIPFTASLTPPLAAQPDSAKHGAILTSRDGWWLAGSVGAAAMLVGSDASITSRALRSSIQNGGFVRSSLDAASDMGGPGALVFSAGLWGVGRIVHSRTPELVGLRATEAILVSGAVTSALKGLTGRARPDQSPGDPRDFAFARGIREQKGFRSFPSGHATTAFALASVLDAEWKRLSPERPRWLRPALYAVAALTAASRVFDNRHWVSDVLVGSVIGTVGGHAVVRWHADRP
ncbi:MAG: phosphatase PAP2 family protein [Gemmatimonadetes bacterium]|nr:phosphatase PAP2 family protein [Gemmatimonadota bacterium]